MEYFCYLFITILVSVQEGLCADEKPILASMTWTKDKGFELVKNQLLESDQTVAVANFTNAINETGWSYLEIKTSSKFPDNVQVSMIIITLFFKITEFLCVTIVTHFR